MWNADFTCNVQLFIFYLLFQSSRLGRVRFTNDINFKVNSRWLQGRLSLSSFRGRSNEYQEFRGTLWLKVNCLLLVAQQPWGSWTSSIKGVIKFFKVILTGTRCEICSKLTIKRHQIDANDVVLMSLLLTLLVLVFLLSTLSE